MSATFDAYFGGAATEDPLPDREPDSALRWESPATSPSRPSGEPYRGPVRDDYDPSPSRATGQRPGPGRPGDGSATMEDYFGTTAAPAAPSGERSLASDAYNLFMSSLHGTLAAGYGAVEYLQDPSSAGGTATRWRQEAQAASDARQQRVSPEMRAALERRFFGTEGIEGAQSAWNSFGDFFGAVGANLISSTGSIIASVPALAAGMLGGGPVGGAVVGAAVGGGLGAGTVFSDTMQALERIPEERRAAANEVFARIRRENPDMPMAEVTSRAAREIAGSDPAIAAAIGVATGAITGRLEGALGAGTAGRGVIRQGVRAGLTEAAGEVPEETFQSHAQERVESTLAGRPYDWRAAAEGGVRGGIGGFGMGAGLGGAAAPFQRHPPEAPGQEPPPGQGQVDPSVGSAAQANQTASTAAGVTPGSGPLGATGFDSDAYQQQVAQAQATRGGATPSTTAPSVDPSVASTVSGPDQTGSGTPVPATSPAPPPTQTGNQSPAPAPPPLTASDHAGTGQDAATIAAAAAPPAPAQAPAQPAAPLYVIPQAALNRINKLGLTNEEVEGIPRAKPNTLTVADVERWRTARDMALRAEAERVARDQQAAQQNAAATRTPFQNQVDANVQAWRGEDARDSAKRAGEAKRRQQRMERAAGGIGVASSLDAVAQQENWDKVHGQIANTVERAYRRSQERREAAGEPVETVAEWHARMGARSAARKAEREAMQASEDVTAEGAAVTGPESAAPEAGGGQDDAAISAGGQDAAVPASSPPSPPAAPVRDKVADAAKAVQADAANEVRKVLGEGTSRADALTLTKALLDDARAEVPAEATTVSAVMQFLRERVKARAQERAEEIRQEIAARKTEEADAQAGAEYRVAQDRATARGEGEVKVAEEGAETGIEDRVRLSKDMINAALAGDEASTEAVLRIIGARRQSDYGTLWRETMKKYVDAHVAAGGTIPDWAAKLRDLAEAGTRGGGKGQRAERTATVEALRTETKAAEETAGARAAAEADAKTAEQKRVAEATETAFDDVPAQITMKTSKEDHFARFQQLVESVRKATGATTRAAQLAAVGDPDMETRAGSIIYLVDRLGKLDPARITPDLLNQMVGAEVIMRGSKEAHAEIVAEMKAEAEVAATAGKGGSGEGEVDTSAPRIIPEDVDEREAAAAAEEDVGREAAEGTEADQVAGTDIEVEAQLAKGDAMLARLQQQTAVDTRAAPVVAETATAAELEARRAARAAAYAKEVAPADAVARAAAAAAAKAKGTRPTLSLKGVLGSLIGKFVGSDVRATMARARAHLFTREPAATIFGTMANLRAVLPNMSERDNELFDRLAGATGTVPIRIWPRRVWEKAFEGQLAPGGMFTSNPIKLIKDGAAVGFIDMPDVYFNDQFALYNGIDMREAVMHEMVHAATFAKTGVEGTKTRAQLTRLMEIVQSHYAKQGVVPIDSMRYALSDPIEFIAMAMTSRDVQDELMQIPLTQAQMLAVGVRNPRQWGEGLVNALKAFVRWINNAVARGDAEYDNALNAAVEIGTLATQTQDQQRYMLDRMHNPVPANASEDDYTSHAVSRMRGAVDAVATALNPVSTTNWSAGARDAFRRAGLAGSTLRQIEGWFKHLWDRDQRSELIDPGGRDSPLVTASKWTNTRSQIAENEFKAFIPAVQQMDSLPAASQDKVSNLIYDANEANAHPDVDVLTAKGAPKNKNSHLTGSSPQQVQARERHKELQKTYKSLNAKERAAYHAMVDVFRKSHETIRDWLKRNAVDRWWASQVHQHLANPSGHPLPIAAKDVAALKQRAVDGKLTAADTAMLADVADQIEVIDNRSKIDGPYAPFQRFGDHVVRWQENHPETVTFKSKADAEAHAKASVASKGPTILKTVLRHYDKAGVEITQADPALEKAEVAAALAALPPTASAAERNEATRDAKAKAKRDTIKREVAAGGRTDYEVHQQIQGVAFFEKLGEANAARDELVKRGVKNVSPVALRAEAASAGGILNDRDLDKARQQIKQDPTLPDATKTAMIERLEAAWLMVTPARRLESSLVKRRKVLGASRDFKRVAANYGVAAANFTAGMQTEMHILNAMRSMADQRDAAAKRAPPGSVDNGDSLRRGEVMREIEARFEERPMDQAGRGAKNPLLRKLQSLSYIYYLASPAYSFLQMSQPWLLTAPMLAGRHGMARGVRELGKAMNDIGMGRILGGGVKDTATALRTLVTGKQGQNQPLLDWVKDSLKSRTDGADLNRMLDTLAAEGLVDADAGLELLRSELAAEGTASRKLGQTEALARAFPASIEVVNRAGSAVAAYRLARKAGKDHDAAVEEAREVVDATQADYSASNTARIMDPRRNPLLAPMMTFKKYSQAMYALLIRQTYLAVKGESKEVRRAAGRTLAYTLGAHMAVAGALGLPTEGLAIMIGAVGLLMGEDEPWDWETWLRQQAANAFGPEAAEAIMKGLPRLAGVDLSGRMGLNSLVFSQDLRSFESRDMMSYAGQFMMGAPLGMVMNAIQAPGRIADGKVDEAMEGLVPKGIRDIMRALRIGGEGMQTRRGDRFDAGRDPTTYESVMQALGFQPAAQAEAHERRNAVQGANRRVTAERADLIRRWRQAEPADRAQQWQRIVEWNADQPRGHRISRENLIASQREAARRERESVRGDYLPRNRRGLHQEGDFANTRL